MNYTDIEKVNGEIEYTPIKNKDYAEVPKRITAFRKLFPDGYITTQMEECDFANGVCLVRAECGYYNDGNRIPLASGYSYEREDNGFINKTSFVENCETSAVGRALGMLGIGIKASIASAEELQNAINKQEQMQAQEQGKIETQPISKAKITALQTKAKKDAVSIDKVLELYKVKAVESITERQYANLMRHWQEVTESCGE